jgi:hypothetical protein
MERRRKEKVLGWQYSSKKKRLVLGRMSSCWEGELDACGFDL